MRSEHVGRQIAEFVLDDHRDGGDNSGASPGGETPPEHCFSVVTCSQETDVVAPSEALASNSRPLLALPDALRQGVIARTLQLSARSVTESA